MSKQYQVKQVETNSRGYKVTRTLSTDDVEEIKALIGSEKSNPKDSKKTSKSTKEFASNKNTKPGSKKDVVIDAEFTEVKGSKKSESKEAKSSGKKTVAKPKALPAPKVKSKESKPKKEDKKKTISTSKKPGVCIFKDKTGRFSIYQETMGFSLYDKNSCVQQLLFETDASKALKVFSEKIKQILIEDKKKSSP